MIKKLIAATAFAFLASWSHAEGGLVPSRVYEVGISSVTLFKISVSSWQATQVDSPALSGRVSMEIQNIDSSVNLWCVPGVSISSTPVNGSRKITPGSTWVLSLINTLYPSGSAADVYCMNDGTSGATNAIVTQMY